ncbi:MAG: hypothetical protein HGA85_09215 [Nanoarchaeota archaeon]|nr:hypothetical protein [Nanoarchaeota archaeon]
MVFSKHKHLYHELSISPFNEMTAVALLPSQLEAQVASLNGGLDLGSRSALTNLPRRKINTYKEMVPGYDLRSASELNLAQNVLDIKSPCSLVVDDMAQLLEEVACIYQVAYAHYVVAINDMYNFPNYCCGSSSRNIFASSLMIGYPNAVNVFDEPDDHDYNAYPFIIKDSGTKCVVVLDPTSDQLWDGLPAPTRPRNMVQIVMGEKWDYKTEWKHGNDLYPTLANHIGTFHDQQRVTSNEDVFTPIKSFFQQAFKNPVPIDDYFSAA